MSLSQAFFIYQTEILKTGACGLEVQSFGQKCLPAPHRTATTKIFIGILPASSPHYRHVTGIKNTINHDNVVMLMEIHD